MNTRLVTAIKANRSHRGCSWTSAILGVALLIICMPGPSGEQTPELSSAQQYSLQQMKTLNRCEHACCATRVTLAV